MFMRIFLSAFIFMDKVPRSRNWRTSIFNVNRCYPDTSQKVVNPSHLARAVTVLYALPLVGIKWHTVTWTCTYRHQQACTQSVQLLKFGSLARELPLQRLHPLLLWVSPLYTPKMDMILFLDLYFSFFIFKSLIHPFVLYDRGSILWSFQMNHRLLDELPFSHHLSPFDCASTVFSMLFYWPPCLLSCNTIIIWL